MDHILPEVKQGALQEVQRGFCQDMKEKTDICAHIKRMDAKNLADKLLIFQEKLKSYLPGKKSHTLRTCTRT